VTGAPAASSAKRRRLAARERRVWRGADAYVTITRALAAELATMFGDRRTVAVVPDGVRMPAERPFVPRPVRRPAIVAYAGNLYPWKGVEILLRALPHLPDVRGLVIGGHPLEPDLGRMKALAAGLGLGERVKFTGQVAPPEVAALLAGADVLVLPNTATAISTTYTSPLKMFEYLATGRPIVASDLPALAEVLRDGANALLVPAGDSVALAGGIRRALDDPDLAASLGRGAYETAAAYSWERRAERLEAVIEAARRGRP
jgi:glycosyltransferase involved in cell wall biosynthesis